MNFPKRKRRRRKDPSDYDDDPQHHRSVRADWKDDSENVELERFGEPVVPDFEIPYHTEIMESFNGIDLDSARRVAGNGFYYLMGDIARLHSAVISYARDFMINRGFTYCVPPFMIRSNVVTGVMSFAEMDAMMYKIEGEASTSSVRASTP